MTTHCLHRVGRLVLGHEAIGCHGRLGRASAHCTGETPVAPIETPVASIETPVAPIETPVAPIATPVAPVETVVATRSLVAPVRDGRGSVFGVTRRVALGRASSARRGMVLIIVLVVIVALSLGALAFSELMIGEREVTHTMGRQIQATALAESGIEGARQFLSEEPDVERAEGAWCNNAERFQGILVIEDDAPRGRGRFSIVAPDGDGSSATVRFGLVCESAKLNLNTLLSGSESATAARDRLMALPDMTEELADCILDWLDEDDEPRESGAEAEYYESLESPYRPTNGPITCLEELLFVRGVTTWHLYGADRNRNGIIDADESDPSAIPDVEGVTGALHCGWSAYLTLFSREAIRQEDGQPKVNLNQDDAKTLYEELEEALGSEWATIIVGYRQQTQLYTEDESGTSETDQGDQNAEGGQSTPQSGGSAGSASGAGGDPAGGSSGAKEEIEYAERATGQLDLSKALNQKLSSVLDLVGSKIKVQYKDSQKSVVVSPQFPNEFEAMREYLPKLMDYVTTDDQETVAGRINVNLAPAEVLASVPGVDATLAEQIVSQRPTDPLSVSAYQQNPTWLLVDEVVSLEQMKTLLPYLTAGGSVYRVQCVGFFDEGRLVARLEAVLDATESPPRMLSLRNLTPLGRGFEPADLGAQQ